MAQIDIETILDSIETFLKANVNTQITAMNTEKGGSWSLATIATDAYIMQSMNNTIKNYNPVVYFWADTIDAVGVGPASHKKLNIYVTVLVADDGNDEYIGKRMLRYGRVFEDLFKANYYNIIKSLKFEVQGLTPDDYSFNSSEHYRIVGVLLETNLI